MDLSSASFFTFFSPPITKIFDKIITIEIPGSYMDSYIHPCKKPDIPGWIFKKETEIINWEELKEKIKNYEIVPGMKIGILRKYDDFAMVILGKIDFSKRNVSKSFMDMRETDGIAFKDPKLLNVFIDVLFDKKIIPDKNLPHSKLEKIPKIVFCNHKEVHYNREILSIIDQILPSVLHHIICEYLPRKYSRKQLFRMLEQEFDSEESISQISSLANETLDLSGAQFIGEIDDDRYEDFAISGGNIGILVDRVVRVIATFCTKHTSIKTIILPSEVRKTYSSIVAKEFLLGDFLSIFQKYMKRDVEVVYPKCAKKIQHKRWKIILIHPYKKNNSAINGF